MRDLRLHAEDAVSQHRKVGTIADSVDRISRFCLAAVEVGCDRGSEVASSGKPPNANAVRMDAEFRRVRTDIAHGALAIENRRGIVVPGSNSVMQHKSSNCTIIEPARHL